MKRRLLLLSATLLTACSIQHAPPPSLNPTPPTTESAILTDVRQLTANYARAGEAYFSPDMKWIIFQAAPRGQDNYQMYLAKLRYDQHDIVGIDDPTRISPIDSRNTCGWFAPDNSYLIFASTAGKEDPNELPPGYQRQTSRYRWSYPKGMDIYRADNWLPRVEKAGPGGAVHLPLKSLTDNNYYDAECDVSPDGTSVVFCSNRTDDLELWSMRPDGTHPHQLTNVKGYDGGPFFSPDGKQLVYRSDRQGNDLLQIFVADVVRDKEGDVFALKNEKQLTHGAEVNWGPYWHPDGQHIFFAGSGKDHSNYEIYMIRSDGSHLTRITFTPGADVLPVISPDGRYMLWASKRTPDQTVQIFIARLKMPKGS